MRAYVQTSRRTALSLPLWLAIPAILLWAAVVVVLGLIGLVLLLALGAFHVSQRAWRHHHPPAG